MRKICVCLLVAVFAVAPLLVLTGANQVATAKTRVDASTGATPNYRTFLESELKGMQKSGGNYTCLKAQDPFTYFKQDWYGVKLSYLLNVEVGLKAGTTGIKVIAGDGFSTTLTLDEVSFTNPDELNTLLAWEKGEENKTGGKRQAIDDEEGPFRLVVPQAVVGPHGVGTDNWNRAVRMVRAIEVQPTPPGLPSVDPATVPAGEVVVYGNILNRKSFTVDQLKSITQHSGTYHWKNKLGTEGDSKMTGIHLDFFIDWVTGALPDVTEAKIIASDGFSRSWPLDEIRDSYLDDLSMMLAWAEDGKALKPEPEGEGPIQFVKPQAVEGETNRSRWIKNTRVVVLGPVDPSEVPDAAQVPTDRIIVCGLGDPHNVPDMWYLAEGYTGDGFQEWICVGNPNSWKTRVIITYMIEGEANKTQELYVEPRSRTTILVNDQVGEGKNVSASVEGYHGDSIVVERAMYWNGGTGGHCAAGVNAPEQEWYLAEGSTAGGFETWVLVQNPGKDKAKVNLTYMTASGPKDGPKFTMDPFSRKTFNVADTVPGDWQVSTVVGADKPVIAERAVYWNGRQGGHCAAGVNWPEREWYLAEGSTAGGFETWVLLQNPFDQATKATITFMNANGTHAGPVVELPARSRKSVNVADSLPDDWQVSTKVTGDRPIIAERAMYWNGRSGGHCESGVCQPKFRSFLAEGATAGGFESWILIQNPGPVDATVYITYLTSEGAVERAPLQVKAGKRESVNVADDVGQTYNVSAAITSTAAVSVERAVYWADRSDGSCSKGYLTW